MKQRYFLALLLCAFFSFAHAQKAQITVSNPKTVAPGESAVITVNLSQEDEVVRNVECVFTLPEGLTVEGKSYNTARLDGFTPTLNIKNGGTKSKVTFMSLSGDYITENDGELFSFTVKAEKTMKVAFDIDYEIATDDLDAIEGSETVEFNVEQKYVASAVNESIDLDDKAEVGISLENEGAVGGFNLDITLPAGMEIEKTAKGKVAWQFSDRVNLSRSVTEKWFDNNTRVRISVIDPMSSEEGLIESGNGEILSFTVKGSLDLALDDKIVINNISISDLTGEHQYNQDGKIEIDVHNVMLEKEDARKDANLAAYTADIENLKKLQEVDLGALSTADYYDFIDQEAAQALGNKLGALLEQVIAAYEAVEKEGVYESLVDYDALKAEVDALAENAQKAKAAEETRVAANLAAAEADMKKLGELQAKLTDVIKGNEEYISEEDNDAIEEFFGEKYEMAIQAALDAVAKAGEYKSPFEFEELEAFIESVKTNIEAAKAEEARKAANQAAAEADMKKLGELQATLTEVIKGNEEYISEEDNDAIEEFFGEKYEMAIQEALDAVAEAGEYESPIKFEKLEAFIESVKTNIEAAKAAEVDRVAANLAAYTADIEALQKIQEEDLGELATAYYYDYIDQEAAEALNEKLIALFEKVNEAYDAVAEEGVYVSLVNYEDLKAEVDAIKDAAIKAWEDDQVKKGDINLDGKVNMIDLTTLVNIVLEKTEAPAADTDRFTAADANEDGTVDIVDYSAILNIILGKTTAAAKARAMETTNEAINFAVSGKELHISLDNFNAYTAMQFDIALPANVAVVSAEKTLRTQGMEVAFNKLANGMTRVVIVSETMEAINGISGDIAVLNLSTATGNVAIDNVIAADANANGHALNGVGDTTAISSIKYNTNANESVYDLNGRAMDTVKSGVNIIRTSNGYKKIIVK